ncbi:MAG: ribonucleotide-diphosphate reductase subunit alpha, partial [Peptococcaceae bacterium]|nr:ribonucleotide-diphosphate reductase subunit alpha [Peptococcaceae bacterium]
RLISIALRSGISIDAIIEQIRGIRCPACIRREGVNVMSCPDAIGRVINKYRDIGVNGNSTVVHKGNAKKGGGQQPRPVLTGGLIKTETEVLKKAKETVAVDNACPECGMPVNHESGCVVCVHCGYSKCG